MRLFLESKQVANRRWHTVSPHPASKDDLNKDTSQDGDLVILLFVCHHKLHTLHSEATLLEVVTHLRSTLHIHYLETEDQGPRASDLLSDRPLKPLEPLLARSRLLHHQYIYQHSLFELLSLNTSTTIGLPRSTIFVLRRSPSEQHLRGPGGVLLILIP